jgi:hypothetical protein
MSDDIRRSRRIREMEQIFVPDYDSANMPSADKRAAYALEQIAFRMGRLDEAITMLVGAITALLDRDNQRH